MIERFVSNIQKKQLFNKSDKLLVAYSSGIDSTVLVELLRQANYTFHLAHCNFKLRGQESEDDELFCENRAAHYNVPIHIKSFNASDYAEEQGISIQMAAREQRYQWFETLRNEHGYAYILTAHHLNDAIETLFINLTRGTGINGLKGIPEKQGMIVRPLLPFSKQELIDFSNQLELSHREDSSNVEIKYKRNFLRHEIIPNFKKLNPSFENSFKTSIQHFTEASHIVENYCLEKKKTLVTESSKGIHINKTLLNKEAYQKTLLHNWLHDYGFNEHQLDQLLTSLQSDTSIGKLFYSDKWQLLIDREWILISKQVNHLNMAYTITSLDDTHHLPIPLSILKTDVVTINTHKQIALLDAEKITFPLTLRRWQEGDKFKPLGLNGFQKLSDFFTRQKINRFEKENTWILTDTENIIWVVNHRIDDRYKITATTKTVLQISTH